MLALAACSSNAIHGENSGPATVGPPTTRNLSGGAIAAPAPTTSARTTAAPAPAATQPAVVFRTGTGVVQSVQELSVPMPSASAGASTPVAATAYRLTVRMDDGSMQAIDQDSRAFRAGDRVRITADGHVLTI
jgi:hypothetical protein